MRSLNTFDRSHHRNLPFAAHSLSYVFQALEAASSAGVAGP